MTAQQTFRNTIVVILTLAAAYALFLSIRILIVLLIAIIVASSIRPAILRLQRRLPAGIAILIVYALIGISLFTLGALILPPAISQFSSYLNNEQGLASRIIIAQDWLKQNLETLTGQEITLIEPNAIRTAVSDAVDIITEAVPVVAGEAGGLLGDFIFMVVMGVY